MRSSVGLCRNKDICCSRKRSVGGVASLGSRAIVLLGRVGSSPVVPQEPHSRPSVDAFRKEAKGVIVEVGCKRRCTRVNSVRSRWHKGTGWKEEGWLVVVRDLAKNRCQMSDLKRKGTRNKKAEDRPLCNPLLFCSEHSRVGQSGSSRTLGH
jgi:hypothetical protein